MNTFSERLRHAVTAGGYSMRGASIKAGLSPMWVSQYLNDEKRAPTVENAKRIATALGVSQAWLLGVDGEQSYPEFLEKYDQLSFEGKQNTLKYMDFLLSEQND